MKEAKYAWIIFPLALFGHPVKAQVTENQGWYFLTHTQKLNNKFDLLADVQLRSANQYKYLGTVLLRGSLSYNFNSYQSVATGYTYKGDWEQDNMGKQYNLENRWFEQYLYKFELLGLSTTFRARLEQRFVQQNGPGFSQRTRAFLSTHIPLFVNEGFTKGVYTTVQDEVFVNMQHKERVNNTFFDQNRTFLSLGYRWNPKINTELGYIYWFQRTNEGDFRRNVLQLMMTTSF